MEKAEKKLVMVSEPGVSWMVSRTMIQEETLECAGIN